MIKTEFVVYPPTFGNPWVLAIIVLSLVMPLLLIGYGWFGARASKLSIRPPSIRLNMPFYGRTILVSSILKESIATASLNSNDEHSPQVRLNGFALGSLRFGWFRLKSGKKALICVTKQTPAVYFETKDGFAVVLTVIDLEQCISTLRQVSREAETTSIK